MTCRTKLEIVVKCFFDLTCRGIQKGHHNLFLSYKISLFEFYLLRCIYNRTRHMPLLMTWFFSAFWHGFYPGYYMFFVPVGVGLFVARKVFYHLEYFFLQAKDQEGFTCFGITFMLKHWACFGKFVGCMFFE